MFAEKIVSLKIFFLLHEICMRGMSLLEEEVYFVRSLTCAETCHSL